MACFIAGKLFVSMLECTFIIKLTIFYVFCLEIGECTPHFSGVYGWEETRDKKKNKIKERESGGCDKLCDEKWLDR